MQLLVNALIAGSLAALLSAGLSLVYGVLGVFNLALGQFALTGGYVTWWLHVSIGLPLPVSILGGVIVAAIVTWIAFEVSVAPFYRRHVFLPLVTTIAFSMILDALILLLFQERPYSIIAVKHSLHFAGVYISVEQIFLIAFTIVFLCAVAWVLHSTSLGRKIRATVQHSDAARSLGISSALLHRSVFIASGILAALGGIYLGIDQNLTPQLGFPLTIKAYAALIAGGKDNFWGTIVCAYLIALLEQLAIGLPWWGGDYIAAGFQSVVALLFIIVVLLLKPRGLFSGLRRAI
ncbi:MAG: branched-chain amino acid ABC transporter permease [Candidatus Peregrinibacteria bacterium]|nr:branched-chain amino acid ABC transporter permease [Candidatus Peregrinibacteria bacterium]